MTDLAPLFELGLRTPRLELRLVTTAEVAKLGRLVMLDMWRSPAAVEISGLGPVLPLFGDTPSSPASEMIWDG